MASRLRITHIITDLTVGGTQFALFRLLSRLDPSIIRSSVIALSSRGPMAESIEQLGISVSACEFSRSLPSPLAMLQLCRLLRSTRPQVVQTWMFHSDFLGGLAARVCFPSASVVWNIRMSSLDAGIDSLRTRAVASACARLSRWIPAGIVVNSDAGRDAILARGYDASRTQRISNGFETEVFHPCDKARTELRAELRVPQHSTLVGLVGRFHPHKDHLNFLKAAREIADARPDVRFVLCGPDVDQNNIVLMDWIRSLQLTNNIHLLGVRTDMPRIQAALDLAVSSSVTEGFPNAIGEAMACAVPCVVTDAGGSAELIGRTDTVVRPRDAHALARCCLAVLEKPWHVRQRLGEEARSRIETHFSMQQIARQYVNLWKSIAGVTDFRQTGSGQRRQTMDVVQTRSSSSDRIAA
ncbi:MAG: glycosyltransferase [Planctomycetaceae bacterium]|nr:glycosyltransferase [Planctomycetaceae bacterium]